VFWGPTIPKCCDNHLHIDLVTDEQSHSSIASVLETLCQTLAHWFAHWWTVLHVWIISIWHISHHVLLIFTAGHPLLKINTIHHFAVLVGQTQTETKNNFWLLFWFVFGPTSSKESAIWIIFPCFSCCV
jgi:hypothetical protein